ncbi:DUF2955 domain-containing protein [Desulfosediminicola flagellatus]|uniref:DUF2955 domain-containing protein n=1 Tax=Desulfosediminicola flagellatus TaxID=2569541 RepID=UPI00142EB265|nr:DUF2955 domain-containing protein [Desulfosediminicola flagellatus]
MTLQNLSIFRLSTGVTAAVAVSYGGSWFLSFLTPIFTFMFLAMPVWIGARMARQLVFRLGYSLLLGIAISEFLLNYPLLCVPVYGLLLFFIYYNDTPTAPPMAAMFMTMGITMIPIISFSGQGVAHVIASYLLLNMVGGLIFAWIFHSLCPNSLAEQGPQQKKAAQPPPQPDNAERARLAVVSTLVALTAVIIFFALNLSQHALAMIYICFMAGTPNTNASVVVMKANATATCIGGFAIIIAFNLLVAVPVYLFLIMLTLVFSLFFCKQIYGGGTHAAAFTSGYTTFLILLGSSTGVDKTAAANFYLRIAQVLFAGLFTLMGLMLVEHFLRPKKWGLRKLIHGVANRRKNITS